MSHGTTTRREALLRLVKLAAVAAGLSAVEVDEVLAAAAARPDLNRILGTKASDPGVKALKVLLAPRSRMAEVFHAEFGRQPATQPVLNRQGILTCPAFTAVGGSCSGLKCGTAVCNGLACGGLVEGGVTDPLAGSAGGAKDPLPTCSGDCSSDCGSDCSVKGVCPSVCAVKSGIMQGEIVGNWLRTKQNDPFVRALFKEFGASSPDALANSLRDVINQRRQGL